MSSPAVAQPATASASFSSRSRSSDDTVRAATTFLGFDYGERRVGVATGNTVSRHATPLATVSQVGDARFVAIAKLIAEWQPDALVVGVPFHPDGAAHETTARARRFANQLRGRFAAYQAKVIEVDERYSSSAALAAGTTADRLDAAAAAIILQQHLDALPSNT